MREAQLYCSFKMQNLAKVRRHRSGYTARPDEAVTCRPAASRRPTETPTPYFNPHGPTPGALHGDDYPLTYDADGYPELPACLDRRPKLLISEAPRRFKIRGEYVRRSGASSSPDNDRRSGAACRAHFRTH